MAKSIMLRSGGGGGGIVVGATAPLNLKALWVDTGNKGALRYYNGTAWVFCAAVYGA